MIPTDTAILSIFLPLRFPEATTPSPISSSSFLPQFHDNNSSPPSYSLTCCCRCCPLRTQFSPGEDEDSDDEEEEDRSLDLLIRFVQNVSRKVSKRARKAVWSVLPSSISSKLVGFSVNGVLILTFFCVLKAFLEAVCTLGFREHLAYPRSLVWGRQLSGKPESPQEQRNG